jgi:hypothetical protein
MGAALSYFAGARLRTATGVTMPPYHFRISMDSYSFLKGAKPYDSKRLSN